MSGAFFLVAQHIGHHIYDIIMYAIIMGHFLFSSVHQKKNKLTCDAARTRTPACTLSGCQSNH